MKQQKKNPSGTEKKGEGSRVEVKLDPLSYRRRHVQHGRTGEGGGGRTFSSSSSSPTCHTQRDTTQGRHGHRARHCHHHSLIKRNNVRVFFFFFFFRPPPTTINHSYDAKGLRVLIFFLPSSSSSPSNLILFMFFLLF